MDLKELLKKLKLSEQTVSTVLGALVIIVVGVLIFNYFRGVGKNETGVNETQENQKVTPTPGEEKVIPEGLPTTYKVQKGDSLWTISQKFFNSGYNWVDIAKENKLKNANVLLVDQELTIPSTEVRKPVSPETGSTQKIGNPISESSYTVVKGDNLWKISVRAYSDGFKWTEIAKANNLENPNIINPGQVLSIPR